MDQSTHEIRKSYWQQIISQCQERPDGVTVRSWLEQNGIKNKAYYYWLRRFRQEAYNQIKADTNLVPASKNPGELIPLAEFNIAPSVSDSSAEKMVTDVTPTAVIRVGSCTVAVTNDVSDRLLSLLIREASHA